MELTDTPPEDKREKMYAYHPQLGGGGGGNSTKEPFSTPKRQVKKSMDMSIMEGKCSQAWAQTTERDVNQRKQVSSESRGAATGVGGD